MTLTKLHCSKTERSPSFKQYRFSKSVFKKAVFHLLSGVTTNVTSKNLSSGETKMIAL